MLQDKIKKYFQFIYCKIRRSSQNISATVVGSKVRLLFQVSQADS